MKRKRSVGRIVGLVLLWIITVLLALQFAAAGASKFSSQGGWVQMFTHWGFPGWFRVAIGVAEVAAAVLLLVPRTARYGAVVVVVMDPKRYAQLVVSHDRVLTFWNTIRWRGAGAPAPHL